MKLGWPFGSWNTLETALEGKWISAPMEETCDSRRKTWAETAPSGDTRTQGLEEENGITAGPTPIPPPPFAVKATPPPDCQPPGAETEGAARRHSSCVPTTIGPPRSDSNVPSRCAAP